MAKVKRTDIVGDILYLTTQKTNDRQPIDLNAMAKSILEKYKDEFEWTQVFAMNPERVQINDRSFIGETPSVPNENGGQFDAMNEKGDVFLMLFGHDHNNSFIGEYKGMKLGYTQGCGFNVYGPGKKRGVRLIDFPENNPADFKSTTLTVDDLEDLYLHIGNGKAPVNAVINTIYKSEDVPTPKVVKVTSKNIDADIIVSGIDKVKVNLANCCNPVYGDEIVGYITKGNGITVHRLHCHNLSMLEDRTLDVAWNSNVNKKYDEFRKLVTENLVISNLNLTSSAIKALRFSRFEISIRPFPA